ncbi:MAG: hypothetical protein GC136_03670 [Alphaproteobacteria bacterium]|nr:hypothetical protein [Alphaproteobacteria bacterium]
MRSLVNAVRAAIIPGQEKTQLSKLSTYFGRATFEGHELGIVARFPDAQVVSIAANGNESDLVDHIKSSGPVESHLAGAAFSIQSKLGSAARTLRVEPNRQIPYDLAEGGYRVLRVKTSKGTTDYAVTYVGGDKADIPTAVDLGDGSFQYGQYRLTPTTAAQNAPAFKVA